TPSISASAASSIPATTAAPTTVPSTAAAPESTDAPPPAGGEVVLGEQDAGRTVSVTRGDTVRVELGGTAGAPWSEPRASDPAVLSETSHSSSGGSVSATFRADGQGRSDISADQSPTCATAQPRCMAPTRLWSVTVEIRT